MKLSVHRKTLSDFQQDGSVMYGLFVKLSTTDTFTGSIGWNSGSSFPETLVCPDLTNVQAYGALLSPEVIHHISGQVVSLHKTFDSLFSNYIHGFIKNSCTTDLTLVIVVFNKETSTPIEYLYLTNSSQCQEFYNEVCTFPL